MNTATNRVHNPCHSLVLECSGPARASFRIEFNNDDDSFIPVYVDKEYACALDVYNIDDHMKSYEDICFFIAIS
jgi:hypothetical protein